MESDCRLAIVTIYAQLSEAEKKTKDVPYYKGLLKNQFPAMLTA
jgi:hypothetical protein